MPQGVRMGPDRFRFATAAPAGVQLQMMSCDFVADFSFPFKPAVFQAVFTVRANASSQCSGCSRHLLKWGSPHPLRAMSSRRFVRRCTGRIAP